MGHNYLNETIKIDIYEIVIKLFENNEINKNGVLYSIFSVIIYIQYHNNI